MYVIAPPVIQQNADVAARTHVADPAIWSALAALPVDPRKLSKRRIVSFERRHHAARAFDILRTKLLKSMREEHWTSIGITSPTAGCGKATVAANLAISLTKHENVRVALVDLDLRRPRIASIFSQTGQHTTVDFLREDCSAQEFFVRFGNNLAIGASPDVNSSPAEILHSEKAAGVLSSVRESLRADLVIYNLPALLDSDDCLGLLPSMNRTLLVVGAEYSTVGDIDVSERELHAHGKLLGVILNKCRFKHAPNANFQA